MKTSVFANLPLHLARFIEPLLDYFQSEASIHGFLNGFGWNSTGLLPTSFNSIFITANSLISNVNSLYNNGEISYTDAINALTQTKSLFESVQNNTVAPIGVDASLFLSTFAGDLTDYLTVEYLKRHQRKAYDHLILLGIITFDYIPETSLRNAHTRATVHYERLLDAIRNPVDLFKQVLGWTTTGFDYSKVFEVIYYWASKQFITYYNGLSFEEMVAYSDSYPNQKIADSKIQLVLFSIPLLTVSELLVDILVATDPADVTKSGILLMLQLPSQLDLSYDLSDDVQLNIEAATALDNRLGFKINREGINVKYPFLSTTGALPVSLSAGVTYKPQQPKILLGGTESSRLELLSSSVIGRFKQNSTAEIQLEIDLSGLRIVLDTRNTDGFLRKIFGDVNKQVPLPIILLWSSTSGFSIKGSGGFEYTSNTHFRIGPLEFLRTTVSLLASATDKRIALGVGTDLRATVGPLSMSVTNVGLQAGLGLQGGNMGPFDLSIGFKPPTGVGLSIDSDTVKGSGFLSLDSDRGIYSGSFQLEFSKFKLNAVGILNTKLPNGAPGYSLLILITAEFNPVQIGLGFTLNGVGGMLGLHRTLDAEALAGALRTGALETILFPQNINDDASAVISSLNTLFPISEGRFLIAPMAKIGWGTPTLITIDMGIMIELPAPVRLAIAGVIRCVLPDPDNPLLVLKCAFTGIIDFSRQFVRFDALIYDSHIKNITLSGAMALRIFWGRQREMLISIGGFHPAYHPPTFLGLPYMPRMCVSLNEGDLKMRLEAYYALSTNTVQLGAGFYLEYEFGGFKAEGHLTFDVLFQFNPFYFSAYIETGVSISYSGNELLGVKLAFTLEGPNPWHAQGYAEFTAFGCSQTLGLDATWGGDKRAPDPRPVVALQPQLLTAFSDSTNWQATVPNTGGLLVSLRKWPSDQLIIHPNGRLQINQKVAPLGVSITRSGQADLSDPGTYKVNSLQLAGVGQQLKSLYESFAPSQYRNMSDEDKLKAPSFESLPAGIEATSPQDFSADYMVFKEIGYDIIITDKAKRTRANAGSLVAVEPPLLASFVAGGRIADNPISQELSSQLSYLGTSVQTASDLYQLVDRDQLLETTTSSIPLTFESEALARDYQQSLGILSDFTRVIPAYYNL